MQKNTTSFNYGTNYASNLNSFKCGVLGSNQDAIGSPTSLVAAIVRLVPSKKKYLTDLGNENISLRGRNSISLRRNYMGYRWSNFFKVHQPLVSIK